MMYEIKDKPKKVDILLDIALKNKQPSLKNIHSIEHLSIVVVYFCLRLFLKKSFNNSLASSL